MSHGSDKRLSSYRWQQFRLTILRRDMHRCQWRLDGCTEYAGTVDHIVPRVWGGAVFDPDNVVAACRACNRKRHDLPPGTRGAYGTRPERRVFSAVGNARGGIGKFSPSTSFPVIRADYSRKAG